MIGSKAKMPTNSHAKTRGDKAEQQIDEKGRENRCKLRILPSLYFNFSPIASSRGKCRLRKLQKNMMRTQIVTEVRKNRNRAQKRQTR